MSSPALVSCLGVSGWGPLHWWLRCDGEPQALLERLRLAWWLAQAGGAPDPRAPLLLASLLRSSTDLIPLAGEPQPPLAGLSFRHRLVCRPGELWLHLRSWECCSPAAPWRCCGLEWRLDAALLESRRACPGAGFPGLSSWLPASTSGADALCRRPAGGVIGEVAPPRGACRP